MKWLGVAALLALLVYAPAAHAHATLIAAEPSDGAMLARAPAQARLTFNEPVMPLVMRLAGASHSVALSNVAADGNAVVIGLPALGQGTHALSWRVISADGHPVGGTVVFSVGMPSARPFVGEQGDAAVRGALWAVKIALYVGLFVGIGGAFFRAFAPDAQAGARLISAALVAGLIAAPLSVGLQGLDALGVPLSALGVRTTWQAGLDTTYGATAIAADIALFAALFSASAPQANAARALALAGLLGCGLALALSGHASAAEPQWLMRPAVFIHALAVAFWIGALLPLGAALRAGGGGPALAWFSRAIPFTVAAMLLAGLALAVVQLGSLAALWTTAYGLVLCAKLAAVLALLVLAAINRLRFTAPACKGDPRACRNLVRAIAAEIALALLIFAFVAVWRFTPPPRALAFAAVPAQVHIHTDKLMADLTLEPGRAGPAQARVVVMRGDFTPADPKEVTLVFSKPDAGIEPVRRPATLREGVWQSDVALPVSGRWQVRIDVLVSDFEKQVLEDEIEIRP